MSTITARNRSTGISTLAALAALAAPVLLLAACNSHDGSASAESSAQDRPAAVAGAEQGAGAAASAGSGAPGAAVQPGEVRRISVADAHKAAADGSAVFYDVRGQAAYDAGHIEGAKLLPGDEQLAEVPKDKLIITYCA